MILTHVLSSNQNKFEMDVKVVPVRKACTQMLKGAIRQQRYRLKQKYFDPFPLNLVTKTSPVRSMTDDQWNELVESWKDPPKMVHFFLETNIILSLPTTLIIVSCTSVLNATLHYILYQLVASKLDGSNPLLMSQRSCKLPDLHLGNNKIQYICKTKTL